MAKPKPDSIALRIILPLRALPRFADSAASSDSKPECLCSIRGASTNKHRGCEQPAEHSALDPTLQIRLLVKLKLTTCARFQVGPNSVMRKPVNRGSRCESPRWISCGMLQPRGAGA